MVWDWDFPTQNPKKFILKMLDSKDGGNGESGQGLLCFI
jgi:hypothetical protein